MLCAVSFIAFVYIVFRITFSSCVEFAVVLQAASLVFHNFIRSVKSAYARLLSFVANYSRVVYACLIIGNG